MIRQALFTAFAVAFFAGSVCAKEPDLATSDEIEAAKESLIQWTTAYQAGDYREQWRLTDARIRHWFDKKRWKDRMTKAARRDGALKSYSIESYAPARAADLPCTELGHCFRPGVKYVVFIIRSEYDRATPAQPEFAVMAQSEDDWLFGGGTFPNRPLGETAVIMTTQDELRYRPGVSFRN